MNQLSPQSTARDTLHLTVRQCVSRILQFVSSNTEAVKGHPCFYSLERNGELVMARYAVTPTTASLQLQFGPVIEREVSRMPSLDGAYLTQADANYRIDPWEPTDKPTVLGKLLDRQAFFKDQVGSFRIVTEGTTLSVALLQIPNSIVCVHTAAPTPCGTFFQELEFRSKSTLDAFPEGAINWREGEARSFGAFHERYPKQNQLDCSSAALALAPLLRRSLPLINEVKVTF